jgi:preprotein translocase subunit SecG
MFVFWFIVVLVIILSAALIVMVLLQPSKGGGMGGSFGGLSTTLGSTFGSRRTLDFLAKGTTWVAGAIGLLCILVNAFLIPRGTTTAVPVTTGAKQTATPTAPQLPGGGPSSPATGAQGGNAQPQGTPQQAPAGGQPSTPPPATPANPK